MNRAVARSATRARPLVALGAALLLSLLAVAALLFAGAFADRTPASSGDVHVSVTRAVGESHRSAPSVHAFHQPASTRARAVAFTLFAAAIAVAAWGFRRLGVARSGVPRTLRITGLPPGRAPPRRRIA